MKLALVLFAALLTPLTASALISGRAAVEFRQSIVKLTFDKLLWVPELRENRIFDDAGVCSAAVVGVKPLTLLTASHCIDAAYHEPGFKFPKITVHAPEGDASELSSLKVAAIVANPKSEFSVNIAKDVAVIIFENNVATLTPLRVNQKPLLQKSVRICGFGVLKTSEKKETVRCALKSVVQDITNPELVLPKGLNDIRGDFFVLARGAYTKPRDQVNATQDNSIVVHRLDSAGKFDLSIAIPKTGDSGGPWLERIAGEWSVAGVSSLTTLFPQQMVSELLPGETEREQATFAGFGAQMATREAKDLFARAQKLGADIQFRD